MANDKANTGLPVHAKYDTSITTVEITLIRVMLARACSTANFPTHTVGKSPTGQIVEYAFCPICSRECQSRNERRLKANLKPIPFRPPTFMKTDTVVLHMVQFHKLDLATIMTWVADPSEDNLSTLLILSGFNEATPNASNT